MLWMLLKQVLQHSARLVRSILVSVYASQIQIRLIKTWRYPDGLLKAGDGLIKALSAEIENSEVVQGFGINRDGISELAAES